MGRIRIIDTKTVTNNANNALSSLNSIKTVNKSLEKILSELAAYWAQNGDQQKFANFLSSELTTLGEVMNCVEEFCSAINEYINSIEATSNKVASGN